TRFFDREVTHRDRLVAAGDEAKQERADLAGQIVTLLRRQVLARVRADRDEAADLHAQRTEAGVELRGGQGLDPARVAGELERDRRDVGRVGERDERRQEVTAAKRIDHGLRRGLRYDLVEPLAALVEVRLAELCEPLVDE